MVQTDIPPIQQTPANRRSIFSPSESITSSESIELNADQNTFHTGAVLEPNRLLYQHHTLQTRRLLIKNGTQLQRAQYPHQLLNLPSPRSLRVRGANSDGVSEPTGTIIENTRPSPFYLSWMAYVIYFILLATVVTYIICYFPQTQPAQAPANIKYWNTARTHVQD